MDPHVVIPVADSSQPGEVRRQAVALATLLGFSAADAGRVALVATEAATNIFKHAGRGQVLLRVAPELASKPGVELLALDQGPGIADVDLSMRDGYSTAGSPGTGLGALSRLASFWDVYSQPERGTAVLVHVWPKDAEATLASSSFVVGAVRVAMPREVACGDGWSFASLDGWGRFLLADGLGHGPLAAVAADEAICQFQAHAQEVLPEVFEAMHGALLSTRGAAVSIAEIALDAAEVRFAGVGNVTGFLAMPDSTRRMVGRNGTVGGQRASVHVTAYPWSPRAMLVLHSDGLNSHTTVDGYPALLAHHPSLVAGVLYRDFARGTDDATVVVAAQRRGGG